MIILHTSTVTTARRTHMQRTQLLRTPVITTLMLRTQQHLPVPIMQVFALPLL
jgi:hypothetical protein